ncbi:MAG TPA: efflux RND transporter periplasmic adaptor subunit [Bryobacteraceae bacterium]|nr:efflux RND transporter periplasmic adaptor subunit [Bryobacteraceae bacterium]
MRRRVLVLPVVAAAGALILWLRREPSQTGAIRISGNIELTEVHISFKIAGRLVERLVDEGQAVRKGMVVARLDQEQLLSQRERERAAVAAAESALAQLLTAIELQRETVEGEIALRRAELEQAQARLRELETGSRPQEIQEARAAAEAARAEHERARKDWERAQVLFGNDDISAAQYDQFRTAFERAAAALRQAEQRLSLIEEGPRKEAVEQARAQAARARAAVRLAEAGRIELRRREQEVALRRAEIARAKAQLAVIEAQLGDTEAVCPVDGVVLVKSAEPGETVAAGTTVLTVGDIERPWLRGYIGERDLGRVKLGQRVRVTTDSYPGRVYWGRVSFIAAEAEFTPKEIQTPEERVKLVYRIKVDLANPRHELKSNMPADAEILVE